MRVADFLSDHQVPFERLWHPPAFTAQKRARFLHVPGRRVAKAVLLHGPEGFVVAVLAATRRVDTAALAHALGGAVRLADEKEVEQVFGNCEYGVASPFGSLYGLPTLLDEELTPETWIVCEGNSHAEAVRLLCRDFERIERPRRLRFAKETPARGRS
jgi:Ala-tRNA(Pro) deacylase